MINRWSRVGVTLLSLLALHAGTLSAQNVSRQQQRATRRSADQAGQMIRTMTRTQARTHQATQNMVGSVARVQTQARALEQQRLRNQTGEQSGSQAGPDTGTLNRARYMWQNQFLADPLCEAECAGDPHRWNQFRAADGAGLGAVAERDRLRDRIHQSATPDDSSQ